MSFFLKKRKENESEVIYNEELVNKNVDVPLENLEQLSTISESSSIINMTEPIVYNENSEIDNNSQQTISVENLELGAISESNEIVLINSAESVDGEMNNSQQICTIANYFEKPSKNQLKSFFRYHPQQPVDNVQFNPKIAYYSNNSRRSWVSYDVSENKYHCSICIAFAGVNNRYI